jgi:transcriptional regulator with XRE-family HTH domain
MVGKLIGEYLKANGIKQTFLAEKTGMTNSAISDICTGKRSVYCVEYFKICKALNLPLEYFMQDIE